MRQIGRIGMPGALEGGIGQSADGNFVAVPDGNGVSVVNTGSSSMVDSIATWHAGGMTLRPTAADPSSVLFALTDGSGNKYIGRLDMPDGTITRIVALDGHPTSLVATQAGSAIFVATDGCVHAIDTTSGSDASLSSTSGYLSLSPDDNSLYIFSGASFKIFD